MNAEAMLRELEKAMDDIERGSGELRALMFVADHGPALVEAVRDAERYRHLRNASGMEGFWIAHGKFGEGCSRWNGEAADRAIDQARAEGGE